MPSILDVRSKVEQLVNIVDEEHMLKITEKHVPCLATLLQKQNVVPDLIALFGTADNSAIDTWFVGWRGTAVKKAMNDVLKPETTPAATVAKSPPVA